MVENSEQSQAAADVVDIYSEELIREKIKEIKQSASRLTKVTTTANKSTSMKNPRFMDFIKIFIQRQRPEVPSLLAESDMQSKVQLLQGYITSFE